MSLHAYMQSQELAGQDTAFYALIMAAMRRADTVNQALLRAAFPDTWEELAARYHAPGGRLESETR